MENLNSSQEKDKEKQYLFKCSQCNMILDLSGKIFYCSNCKSNFCFGCLKGHNEIFFDHDIHQTNEEMEYSPEEVDKNSLLANPDLDLDDRCISDNKLPLISKAQSDKIFSNKKYSELNMLFQETLITIQESFNEGICKLHSKNLKNENNINNNENKILDNNNSDLNFDIENLKLLSPLERLQKIMDIVNVNNK